MESLRRIYDPIRTWVGSVVLLLMRFYWGLLFFQAGYGKLQNIDNVIGFFENLGIVYPEGNAWLVALIETIGGICLMLGFLSPIITIPLIIIMITAYLTAHWEGAAALFTNPELFISQTPFMFLLTSLLVFAFGPGKISLDYLFWERATSEKS